MVISYGKKYWLSFCGSYGYFAAIRKTGTEPNDIVMYQFNDASTGIPHFCYQNKIDELIKEEPSDSDSDVLKKIEETKKKLIEDTKEDEQLSLFSMMDED